MQLRALFLSIVLTLLSGELWARKAPLSDLERTIRPVEISVPRLGMYLAPNEDQPEFSLPILRNVRKGGAYLAVGTERGFITAALSGDFSAVLLVDSDPNVARFNRINVALLSLAGSREDYLFLRYRATHEQVLSRIVDPDLLSENVRREIFDSRSFNWWVKEIRPDPGSFSSLNWKSEGFETSSYLHLDSLFQRVQRLAKKGEIYVVTANLADMEDVKRISNQLVKSQVPVSLVDLSNAWWPDYMGHHGVSEFIRNLKPALSEDSTFMLTQPAVLGGWRYLGLALGQLREVLSRSGYGHQALADLFRSAFAKQDGGAGVFVGHGLRCESLFLK